MKRKHSWDDESLNESDDDFDWTQFDLSHNDEPCDKKVSLFLRSLTLSKKESYIFCYLNGLDFLSLYHDNSGNLIEPDEEDSLDDEHIRKPTGLLLLAEKLELTEEQTLYEIDNLKSKMYCKFEWGE